MKCIVYLLGQRAAYARHPGQVLDTGARDFLHASELFEELLSAPRPHAGNRFQGRHRARPGAPLPVSGYGKPVCLVADLLYQVQRR